MMTSPSKSESYVPDLAGVFAAALSLWTKCNLRAAADPTLILSECYNGMDQLMREVMRIAELFESWACQHICFDELNEVWPYLLDEKFGEACLDCVFPSTLTAFNEDDCLRVAMRLHLPIILNDRLPIPVDVRARNPVFGSEFLELRIQTMRESNTLDIVIPFIIEDEPYDEEYGAPFFRLVGISEKGAIEQIADRATYAEAVSLARKLAPGVEFPHIPVLFT